MWLKVIIETARLLPFTNPSSSFTWQQGWLFYPKKEPWNTWDLANFHLQAVPKDPLGFGMTYYLPDSSRQVQCLSEKIGIDVALDNFSSRKLSFFMRSISLRKWPQSHSTAAKCSKRWKMKLVMNRWICYKPGLQLILFGAIVYQDNALAQSSLYTWLLLSGFSMYKVNPSLLWVCICVHWSYVVLFIQNVDHTCQEDWEQHIALVHEHQKYINRKGILNQTIAQFCSILPALVGSSFPGSPLPAPLFLKVPGMKPETFSIRDWCSTTNLWLLPNFILLAWISILPFLLHGLPSPGPGPAAEH